MNLLGTTLEAAEDALLESREIVTFAVVQTLDRLELDIHAKGWNGHPGLFVVVRRLAPPDDEFYAGGDAMVVGVAELARGAFAGLNESQVGRVMTAISARDDLPGPPAPAGFDTLAFAFVTESKVRGWGHRPWKVRLVSAVDSAGLAYLLRRRRDSDARHIYVDSQHDLPAPFSSEIMAGLRALMEAVE